jgi:hypothetical protein
MLIWSNYLHSGPQTVYDLTSTRYRLIKWWLPNNSYKTIDTKQCSICSEIDNKNMYNYIIHSYLKIGHVLNVEP